MRGKRLIENIKHYFFGTLAIKIIQFIFIPIYSVYVSVDDFGYFNMVVSVLALALPILYQSIWEGVLRFVISEKKREKIVLNTATLYCILLSSFYIIIYFIFTSQFEIKYSLLILLMGISQVLASYWQFAARAMKCNDIYVISTVVNSSTTIILNILLIIIFKSGLAGLFIANTIGNLAMFIMLESKLKLIINVKLKNFDRLLLKLLLSYSIPLCINGLSWWLMTSSNNLVISWKIGIQENGIYSMANRFGTIMSLVTSVINMAWQEESFRIQGEEEQDKYFNDVFEILYSTIFSAILVLIPITYFVYDFMIFGNYKKGVVYISLIYLTAGFSAFASHFASSFLANNNTKVVLTTTLIGGGISCIGGYMVASTYGVYGVVVTSLIGSILTFILRVPRLKIYINVKINYYKFVMLFSSCFIVNTLCRIFISSFLSRCLLFSLVVIFIFIINKELIINIYKSIKQRRI